MTEDVKRLAELLDGMRRMRHQLLEALMTVTSKVKPVLTYSKPELVDLGFLCREAEDLLDDLRKDAKARKELCGYTLAVKLTEENLNDNPANGEALRVRGELASAEPDVKVIPAIPGPGRPGYTELMTWLGVPADVLSAGLVKADWDALCKHINGMVAEGKPLPPGVPKTWPDFRCVFTRRRAK